MYNSRWNESFEHFSLWLILLTEKTQKHKRQNKNTMNDENNKNPTVIDELKKGAVSSGAVEKEFVQKTYDLIAPHFSSTRYKVITLWFYVTY